MYNTLNQQKYTFRYANYFSMRFTEMCVHGSISIMGAVDNGNKETSELASPQREQ